MPYCCNGVKYQVMNIVQELLGPQAPDWRDDALCGATDDEGYSLIDAEIFFPVGTPGNAAYDRQVEEAKAICHRCPVSAECLAWSVESGQTTGVWGGTEEQERTSLLRNARLLGMLTTLSYTTSGQIGEELDNIINKIVANERAQQAREARKTKDLQKQG